MRYILSSLILLCVLVACQKEINGDIIGSGTGPVTTDTSASFISRINGVKWVADQAFSARRYTASQGQAPFISITGVSRDGRRVSLRFLDSGQNKTYQFLDTSFNLGSYVDQNGRAYYTNQGDSDMVVGTVTLTTIDEVNRTMTGSFAMRVFRRSDSTQVKFDSGSFVKIPFTTLAYVPPAAVTDTFHVKIEDTLFTAYAISAVRGATDSIIRIVGSDTTGNKIVGVALPDSTTVGTYQISVPATKYSGSYKNGTTTLSSVSGSLEVLENDRAAKRIRGNFSFRAELPQDSTKFARLTVGYFSVKYQ